MVQQQDTLKESGHIAIVKKQKNSLLMLKWFCVNLNYSTKHGLHEKITAIDVYDFPKTLTPFKYLDSESIIK